MLSLPSQFRTLIHSALETSWNCDIIGRAGGGVGVEFLLKPLSFSLLTVVPFWSLAEDFGAFIRDRAIVTHLHSHSHFQGLFLRQ